MAELYTPTFLSGEPNATAINTNLQNISDALNQCLSRFEYPENQLEDDIDANGYTVSNLGEPQNDNDAVSLKRATAIIGNQFKALVDEVNSLKTSADKDASNALGSANAASATAKQSKENIAKANEILQKSNDILKRAEALVESSETSIYHFDSLYELISSKNTSPVVYSVKSFWKGENLGGGQFYYDESSDKARANGGTIIDPDSLSGFDGTPATRDSFLAAQGTKTGKGCFVRIYDAVVTLEMFGAHGNCSDFGIGDDDHAAVDKCLNYLVRDGFVSSGDTCGFLVDVPNRAYRMSDSLNIRHVVTLRGAQADIGNAAGSQFVFDDPSKAGVILNGGDTDGAFNLSKNGENLSAGGASFTNIAVVAKRDKSADYNEDAPGWLLRTRAYLDNCCGRGFNGDGIWIRAGGHPGDKFVGNANNFHLKGGRYTDNRGQGCRINGKDANAGVIDHLDCSSNELYGFWDDSFLGNLYTGCHTNGNDAGAYKVTGRSAKNLFLYCYAEPNQGPSDWGDSNTIIIGGQHQNDWANQPPTYIRAGQIKTNDIVAQSVEASSSARRALSFVSGSVRGFGLDYAGYAYSVGVGTDEERPIAASFCRPGSGDPDTGDIVMSWSVYDPKTSSYDDALDLYRTPDRNGSAYNRLAPSHDDSMYLGRSDRRWSGISLSSSPSVTSDGREKNIIGHVDEDEALLATAKSLRPAVFKYKSAVAKKGDKARKHIGFIAQEIIEAFKAHQLDAFEYGVVGYDEWREYNGQSVEVDENNKYHEFIWTLDGKQVSADTENAEEVEILHNTEAKNRYNVRMDELLTLLVSSLIQE